MILGHNHPAVREAVTQALAGGTSFGAPNEREVDLAELIVGLTGAERVRFVSSGTEATMSALRLARGTPGASTSSNSGATTTGTPTACSSRRAAA